MGCMTRFIVRIVRTGIAAFLVANGFVFPQNPGFPHPS
jgi:hypothetical protein